MILRPHKIALIKKNFIEFSIDDDIESEEQTIPDFKKFSSLNAVEQYYLVNHYNWDDGPIVMQWIINSPKCDKGTACKIFWATEPDYYFDFTEQTIDEFDRDIWLLLQSIIKRFKADNFKSNKLKFIPSEEGYKTNWTMIHDIWEIPDSLLKGVQGKKPFGFGIY